MLIRHGEITAVGQNVVVPSNARAVDATGELSCLDDLIVILTQAY